MGLSGLFTLSCYVVMYFSEQGIIRHLTRLIPCSLNYSTTCQDNVNKPLSPTSDSADYLFTKLQYYMSGQGK
jgi:hypothetical protein